MFPQNHAIAPRYIACDKCGVCYIISLSIVLLRSKEVRFSGFRYIKGSVDYEQSFLFLNPSSDTRDTRK